MGCSHETVRGCYDFASDFHCLQGSNEGQGAVGKKTDVLDTEIKTSVKEIDSVSAITDELNDIKEVITNAVTDLSAISEQTAATNEEVTASVTQISKNVITISNDTEHLNELSDTLKDAVSYFKM